MSDIKLKVKVTELRSDDTTYKRYGITLEPENLYVLIPINEREVYESDSDDIEITIEGLVQVAGRIIDVIHDDYDKRTEKRRLGE